MVRAGLRRFRRDGVTRLRDVADGCSGVERVEVYGAVAQVDRQAYGCPGKRREFGHGPPRRDAQSGHRRDRRTETEHSCAQAVTRPVPPNCSHIYQLAKESMHRRMGEPCCCAEIHQPHRLQLGDQLKKCERTLDDASGWADWFGLSSSKGHATAYLLAPVTLARGPTRATRCINGSSSRASSR